MASTIALSPFPCSNTSGDINNGTPCPKEASIDCKKCHLVGYCSNPCSKAHWRTHKKDCENVTRGEKWQPRWVSERRTPIFFLPNALNHLDLPVGESERNIWGAIPAFDILQINENEGKFFQGDLRLCFAALGDMRKIVTTISKLPPSYTGHCEIVLNNEDDGVVVRNFIMLYIAMTCPPRAAAETILHLLYSVKLTEEIDLLVKQVLHPILLEVINEVLDESSPTRLIRTWPTRNGPLKAVFSDDQWRLIARCLMLPISGNTWEHKRRAVMNAPHRIDVADQRLYKFSGERRMCDVRFRETGMLLPFSSSDEVYKVPNPTLFDESGWWIGSEQSDPLDGWHMEEVLESGRRFHVPQQDLYGNLNYHVREKLEATCQRLQKHKVSIYLFGLDIPDLPPRLKTVFPEQTCMSDRIDVASLAERDSFGLALTLNTLGPLLKPVDMNPKAALIAIFPHAAIATEKRTRVRTIGMPPNIPDEYFVDHSITRFLPFPATIMGAVNPDVMRIMFATMMFIEFDKFFDQYMQEKDFPGVGEAAGLMMREEHTIVQPWPFRLDLDATDEAAKRKFDLLHATAMTGGERYVEWVRRR